MMLIMVLPLAGVITACSDASNGTHQEMGSDSDTPTDSQPNSDSFVNEDSNPHFETDTTPPADTDSDTATDTATDVDVDTGTDSQTDTTCAAPPSQEAGFLWFSGYEADPWDAVWGLEWQSLDNHEVTPDGVLFGQYAARVTYPAGLMSAEGGSQYRMSFDLLQSPIVSREALYVRYYVKFDEDIDFVLGGKLPGFIGGTANTGGNPPNGMDGWSARIMWRANGRIVQYVYHPDQPGEYGEDMDWNLGGGSRYFIPGQWHCVETFIGMNTVNGEGETNAAYDGQVRSWLDGELALERTDVRFRYTNDFAIDGFYFSTFFGGSTAEWAPVKDEHAMFDNFVISDTRIGCLESCMIPKATPPGPDPITVLSSTLVFNGDDAAFSTGNWNNNGTYDYQNEVNHTPSGAYSAHIVFDPAAWDATVFGAAAPFNPGDYTHLRMWIRPSGMGVRFRTQFRGSTTSNSADVIVDGSPTYHTGPWQPNTWQEVIVPIADFASEQGQQQLLIRADTNTPTDGFWIDDLELVVAD
ncbi:MAG: hypothetical protein JXR76_28975 [Deltaproteobacteria bacterium]|nr:hypothetical protein [Deltaproteobacteria bacterium]